MGRYIKVIFFLLLCILLTGCDKKMPEITFVYISCNEYDNWYEECVIDNQGNIYYTNEKEVYDYTTQDLANMCKAGSLSEEMECIGTIEVAELQDMYNMCKEVVDDEYEVLDDGLFVDGFVKRKSWFVVSYDENGDLEHDYIYKDGDACYEPSDERAWDIVNWMNEVMGVETMKQSAVEQITTKSQ